MTSGFSGASATGPRGSSPQTTWRWKCPSRRARIPGGAPRRSTTSSLTNLAIYGSGLETPSQSSLKSTTNGTMGNVTDAKDSSLSTTFRWTRETWCSFETSLSLIGEGKFVSCDVIKVRKTEVDHIAPETNSSGSAACGRRQGRSE